MVLWFFILLVAVFEAIGQSMIAQSRYKKNINWLFIGILCYCVVAYGLFMSYQYKGVGIVNALWSSISIILMLGIGCFVFKEKLDKNEWFGIFLILVGIVFINFRLL